MSYLNSKKFSLFQLIVLSILLIAVTVAVEMYLTSLLKKERQDAENNSLTSCLINTKRLNGYKLIKPLMFVDEDCQSSSLKGINSSMTGIIDKYKATGNVKEVSVYLREYNYGNWTSINDNETYEPGSLFKVPVMIAILKMSESNPALLNKSLTYTKPIQVNKSIAFPPLKSIELGKSYTVKELMTYMIRYSDNKATILLETQLDEKTIQKLFTDFGLEAPSKYASSYLFTVKDYSLFMRSLYNSTYLSPENSEYAAELMEESAFKNGIRKGIPNEVKMISKFGEAGNPSERQLHETALVYVENKPFLITIMTKGTDFNTMSQCILELSTAAFNEMLEQAHN